MLKKSLVLAMLFAYLSASSVLAHSFAMDKMGSDGGGEGCASMQHMQEKDTNSQTPNDTGECYNDCFGSYDEFSFAKITEDSIGSLVSVIFPSIDIFLSHRLSSPTIAISDKQLFSLGPPYEEFFKNTVKIE